MNNKFHCGICDLSFSSGYTLAQHFRSKEHRDRLNFGADSIMEKFIEGVKAAIDPNQTGKKN